MAPGKPFRVKPTQSRIKTPEMVNREISCLIPYIIKVEFSRLNIFKHLSKNNKIMIKISNLSFYCNSFITLVRLKQNFQLYSCKLFCFFDEDHLGGIITGVEQLTETSHYHAQFPQHLNSSRNIFNTFSPRANCTWRL